MNQDKLVTQLRRIEGQVRGVTAMIEAERGLVPTVQQLMAIQSAMKKVTGQYIQLFMVEDSEGNLTLTREQVEYILKLID